MTIIRWWESSQSVSELYVVQYDLEIFQLEIVPQYNIASVTHNLGHFVCSQNYWLHLCFFWIKHFRASETFEPSSNSTEKEACSNHWGQESLSINWYFTCNNVGRALYVLYNIPLVTVALVMANVVALIFYKWRTLS